MTTCDIIRDLIPLYIDDCCSDDSKALVDAHLHACNDCRRLLEGMTSPTETVPVCEAPKTLQKLNDWKASILQSILLFASFLLCTIGVALEASTPSGSANGAWACLLIIPSTALMLSLSNWYFLRFYRSAAQFSAGSLLATALLSLCGYLWAIFHYELLSGSQQPFLLRNSIGLLVTLVFCLLSKLLSMRYAAMLGKD